MREWVPPWSKYFLLGCYHCGREINFKIQLVDIFCYSLVRPERLLCTAFIHAEIDARWSKLVGYQYCDVATPLICCLPFPQTLSISMRQATLNYVIFEHIWLRYRLQNAPHRNITKLLHFQNEALILGFYATLHNT